MMICRSDVEDKMGFTEDAAHREIDAKTKKGKHGLYDMGGGVCWSTQETPESNWCWRTPWMMHPHFACIADEHVENIPFDIRDCVTPWRAPMNEKNTEQQIADISMDPPLVASSLRLVVAQEMVPNDVDDEQKQPVSIASSTAPSPSGKKLHLRDV